MRKTLLFSLVIIAFSTTIHAQLSNSAPAPAVSESQVAPTGDVPTQASQPPATGSVPPSPAPATPEPKIESVSVYSQAAQVALTTDNPTSSFILELDGKNFETIKDMTGVRIIPFPATGVSSMTVVSRSLDGTRILARFDAPAAYSLQQVALSVTGASFVTYSTDTESCDFSRKVVVIPEIVPLNLSKTTYGDGIGSNFYVIQISIVNKCSMPINVPLAGFKIVAKGSTEDGSCKSQEKANLSPSSLEQLTSYYSADRKLTGHRAKYFNSLQAIATIGSSVEPFLASGFTQAVAILGGGFTTASKEIFVDMSSEQLQNITSQSFGSIEQVASGGGLQKYIFVRRVSKCGKSVLEGNLASGQFDVRYELLPASTKAPETQQVPASTTQADPTVPATITSLAAPKV